MKITFNYDIIGSYPYTVDLEDYIEEEEWEKMTEEEQDDFMFDLGYKLQYDAERECSDWSLGEMENYTVEED